MGDNKYWVNRDKERTDNGVYSVHMNVMCITLCSFSRSHL